MLDSDDPDIRAIGDMLVPISVGLGGVFLFTCQHFDTESRQCLIYERRPDMCRGYPYEGRCGFCGYTEPSEHVNERAVFTHDVGVTTSGNGWYRKDGEAVHGVKSLVEVMCA